MDWLFTVLHELRVDQWIACLQFYAVLPVFQLLGAQRKWFGDP
jgi:hypothetical protein